MSDADVEKGEADPATVQVSTADDADATAKPAANDAEAADPKAAPSPSSSASGGAAGGAVCCGLSRTGVALVALAVFLVVAIGVGVGVGVGVGMQDDDDGGDTSYTSIALGDANSGATYFVAADRVSWNYAPAGGNKCYSPDVAARLLPARFKSVGGTFLKAQYRAYTDSSFKTLAAVAPEWEHLGNVGPVITATVGDVVRIVFRNNLPFPVNLAPSGGLVAWDGAGRTSARTAPVAPGGTATYLWRVPAEAGPGQGSTVGSRLWLYRSTVDPEAHDNAGLVGPVLVSGAGAAKADREIITIFQVINELSNPFLYDNNAASLSGIALSKMAINGFTWCNMPPAALTLRTGQRVRWHVASVGSSSSLHNYHWHGSVVELNGHHVDQFSAIPTAAYSVNMVPDEPGTWMFHCHVNFHMEGGMVDTYTVVGNRPPLPSGTVRTYYVAAEEVAWAYTGPDNMQACGLDATHTPVSLADESVNGYQFVNGPSTDPVRLGASYTKALFIEYEDDSFAAPKNRSEHDAYLGMVGPLFRAVVGDTIKVVLLNKASFPVSMHPHGMRYDKASEGTEYEDGTSGAQKKDDAVQPGETYTYTWIVADRSGPGPADPSSLLWMYHSHLNESADTYAGLMGGILVTAAGKARSATDLTPADVDDERTLFFTVFDEIKSALFMHNLRAVAPAVADDGAAVGELIADPDFQEHMLKHAINGHMYCNLPRLTFELGAKVRVHAMVLGTVEDMHTPALDGPVFATAAGARTEVLQMAPGSMITTDVVMTVAGTHELQCRVADHVLAGMRALYDVVDSTNGSAVGGGGASWAPTRTFYIQAEPLDWDYAPNGYQRCTDADLRSVASVYLDRSSASIGSRYRKAVYREYTDASFTTRKAAPSYYGTMGPLLVAEVGDTLQVTLRNALDDLAGWPVNLAPGGGLEDAGSDAGCKAGLEPGSSCTYRWRVPESAGPAAADFNTVAYGYTSTTDVTAAPNAGLAGALLVAAKGALGPNGLPQGVDVLAPLYWQVVDEGASPYSDLNAAAAGLNLTAVEEDEALSQIFGAGNRKHSINGFSYCNMPRLSVTSGQTVRWVLVAYGTEGDFHAPMFQGQVAKIDVPGSTTSASLMPSVARVVDMQAGDPGTWLLYCDVHDHFQGGMMAQFVVKGA